ncbi:hypothetical protein [Arenibaculum pallidiluteum]|uniref:hypothetical protein n=1 Tax=Arenibaculum pallidiluteum TaxID=2812559 RepID=UPI001A96715C|nr:hypothetical protein [Arenibaculum pallidiluteum]
MTIISSGQGPSVLGLRRLDTSQIRAVPSSELPDNLYTRLIASQTALLEHKYSQPPDLSDSPAYKKYARVVVSGKVVAELDNNGILATSNALATKLKSLPGDVNGVTGPILAQARAEFIARQLGGEIEKFPTALTQSAYNAIAKPVARIDRAAMERDPMFQQLQKTISARTLYLAQQGGAA